MTTTPRVSVLITAYNRERYIAAAIESALAQTFTDFELLIVDDCSTDQTVAIASRYLDDPRVRLVVNGRNLGQFPNRNYAAELARGEFLKYHDSDDLMYAHCLEVMESMLDSEPRAGFGLSAGTAWPGGPCPMLLTPRMAYAREFLGQGLFMCGPSGALFRTRVFRELGGFEDHGVPSDLLFWIKACARVNVLLFPADLFWYRTHAGQALQSNGAALEYARVSGAEWRALHAEGCPLDGEELEQAKRNRAFVTAKIVWHDLVAGRPALAAERLRHAGLSARDWARYLRRPRRTTLAGTPLEPSGEYVVPVVERS